MLRVAFFGSDGEFSSRSLRAVADRHDIVAVVTARPRSRGHPLLAVRRSLGALARRLLPRRANSLAGLVPGTVPHWQTTSGEDGATAARLADINPDVVCIAGYPWLLPAAVFTQPPLGAINLHGSLLPRHRGILPLFWIYYHDDRETGVTVHRVEAPADAGAILAQEGFALPRGMPVDQLNSWNAERGGMLLQRTLDAIERGGVHERPQDDSRATQAPRVSPGLSMVNFDEWPVERVWHFLAGLNPYFREPLRGRDGRPVRYRRVIGYSASAHERPPGRVERTASGCALFCQGGIVELW